MLWRHMRSPREQSLIFRHSARLRESWRDARTNRSAEEFLSTETLGEGKHGCPLPPTSAARTTVTSGYQHWPLFSSIWGLGIARSKEETSALWVTLPGPQLETLASPSLFPEEKSLETSGQPPRVRVPLAVKKTRVQRRGTAGYHCINNFLLLSKPWGKSESWIF